MTTLRLLLKHEMISLEPNSYNTDSSSATVILKGTICQSLVRLNRHMELEPELAESWTVSEDKRVFRFRLREGVRFHNGAELSADIVVWNFRRLFDSLANSLLKSDYAGLESVRATDPMEVEFRFAEPNVPFLHDLAWRTHVTTDDLTQPVGTGPFKAVEWIRRDHVILERFEDYWEPGRPKVDRVEIRWAPDAADCVRIIEEGGADIVESLPGGAAPDLATRHLIVPVAITSPRKTVIAFRCNQPPFDNVLLRRAVAHALDRPKMIEAVFGKHGHLVDGVLPASDPWAVPLDSPVYDPDLARRLVAEAGYPDGLDVAALMTNVAPVPRFAGMVCDALDEIGIRLNIRGFDDPPWWPYLYLEGQWQLAFQGASARPHINTLFRRDLVSSGAFNPGAFSNARLDELVLAARSSLDPAEERKLYAEAQQIVHDEKPILPLYAADVFSGHRPGVAGFSPHPLGYIDLRDVTID